MAKKKNPFDVFKPVEKKAKIKALGGYEITYRELTNAEDDEIKKRSIKGYDMENGGAPIFDMDNALNAKYDKVAMMLIEPSVTADDLKQLTGSSDDAIEEILSLLDDADDLVDEEGN